MKHVLDLRAGKGCVLPLVCAGHGAMGGTEDQSRVLHVAHILDFFCNVQQWVQPACSGRCLAMCTAGPGDSTCYTGHQGLVQGMCSMQHPASPLARTRTGWQALYATCTLCWPSMLHAVQRAVLPADPKAHCMHGLHAAPPNQPPMFLAGYTVLGPTHIPHAVHGDQGWPSNPQDRSGPGAICLTPLPYNVNTCVD